MRTLVAAFVIPVLSLLVSGCGDDGADDGAEGADATEGDCNIVLALDGNRYAVHTDLGEPPLGASLGTADQVGCAGDRTVYGTEQVREVEGISPDVAISSVPVGDEPAYVYLNEDLPRDRAPDGWPIEVAPDAFE